MEESVVPESESIALNLLSIRGIRLLMILEIPIIKIPISPFPEIRERDSSLWAWMRTETRFMYRWISFRGKFVAILKNTVFPFLQEETVRF